MFFFLPLSELFCFFEKIFASLPCSFFFFFFMRRCLTSRSYVAAKPGEEHILAVDAALRRVCHELLEGTASEGVKGESNGVDVRSAAAGGSALAAEPVVKSLAYLRDRVGVPRDMHFPAARQLRAHLNWFIDSLHTNLIPPT